MSYYTITFSWDVGEDGIKELSMGNVEKVVKQSQTQGMEEEMKIDMNKTYRTRDGREVRIYSTEAGGTFPVHGAVCNKLGRWEHHGWTAHGLWSALYINSPNDLDLVEVRPERVVWINEYEGGSFGTARLTKETANHWSKDRVALHRVVLGPDTEVKDD